jgi:hypothetical protein
MRTPVKLHKLLWVVVSLLLVVAPLHTVQGQEAESDAADGVNVEQQADAVDAPLSEDVVAAPAVDAPFTTYLPVIGGSGHGGEADTEEAEEVDAAFQHGWVAETCTNVLATERGLWDDMPGAGVTLESGLFWLVTNSALNETCSFHSDFATVLANQFAVRVAVNDSARFYVRVYGPTLFGGCTTLRSSFITPAINDDSAFRTYTVNFALSTICRVQIILTDDPDNAPTLRSTALIDYIVLRNGLINVWLEHFTRTS